MDQQFTFEKTNNQTEELPVPASQTGPEARNYVAYIPVPINDEEEEDEEYYDEYDEYDEYYEEEYEYEEEEKPARKRKNKKRRKDDRKSKPGKGRFHPSKSSTEDKERVPFLVPLMMVPENQVGVQKEFTFSKNPNDRIGNLVEDDADDGGVFTSILNLNKNKRFPSQGLPRRPPARPRPSGIPSRSTHNIPGPPYRGPAPRNPNLPLDKTVIHPSIHRPRFRRPPRNFRPRQYSPTTSSSTTTEVSSTTETTTAETVTKPKANIIVVQQQPNYSPYRPHYGYNPYQPPPVYQPYPYPPYPSPPPPTTTSTTSSTTTTSTTTTTIKTTTSKSRKKRKKRKKKPEFLHNTNLSDDQITSLSQPQLTIVDNKLVPIMNKQQQSILSKRFGLQARRFNQPFKVRGRRRLTGSQSSPHRGPYRDQRPHSERRFDMPNIFTQSGFPYEQYEEERPIISRPPPRHPGVRVPGVRVPANAGSIEDIIQPKPVVTNNYRPPVQNVVHVHYDEKPPRRPDNKYKKPAHRPHLSPRPHYDEPQNDPPYRPPPPNSYRPKPSNVYDGPPSRPKPSNDYDHRPSLYDEPPPRPLPSNDYDHRPNVYDEPPRPPPATDYDYRPKPSNNYDEPPRPARPPGSNEYDYGPPSYSEYEEPPRRPRPHNVDDGSKYRPGASGPSSYPEETYYEPPENEFGPIVEDYQPARPENYRPQAETVVPPAYNQDYYLTPDPQSDVYPGPDIYDGGSVHGPTSGDRKTQFDYRPAPPTLGPPTRRPQTYQPPPSPPRRDSGYPARPAGGDNKFESERFHPDGPDYSSGTLINSYKGSAPFKVGVDLYPMGGVSPLGGFGKQDIYSSVIPQAGGRDDNKHEILLHLNLFSKKPSILGGRAGSRAQDIDIESPAQQTR